MKDSETKRGGLSETQRTVLIVDDESSIRWSLGEAFSAAGYRVQEACDADETLTRLGKDGRAADVVLLDLKLPGAAGLGLLNTVKERLDRPVILMTAHATRELTQEALEAGASRVILKPFDLDELVRLVAELINPSPSAEVQR